MITVEAERFYERLTDLFYERLLKFAQQRINGAVNREYSPEDVVGTTLRTLLRREIHQCPRLRVVSENQNDQWQTLVLKSTKISVDGDEVRKFVEADGTRPTFVIAAENRQYLLKEYNSDSVEHNSIERNSTAVLLQFGDTFKISGHKPEFLFDYPHLPEELWSLLVTVAARKIAKVQRTKFKHLFINETALEFASEFSVLTQLSGNSALYRQSIEREVRSTAIRDGFKKVAEIAPDRLLHVLEMRLDGMSNQSIANELGLSVSRVKQLLKKIRDIIAKSIEDSYTDS